MTEFLVRCFVKEYTEIEKVSVRTACKVPAGVVDIFCNVYRCVITTERSYIASAKE